MRFKPEQHLEMARRLQARCEVEPDPEKAEKQARMANVFLRLAEKARKQLAADVAPVTRLSAEQTEDVGQPNSALNGILTGSPEEPTDPFQGAARDYFAEYHSAIEAYERELKRAFGFAFMPECNQDGAQAPLGSELRRAYDTMIESRKARDERHPPGTWMG
ncbi:hypothetical protein [Bradyrhizobium betae]|uniref:Uncharacterized protein n=1 Tax=Bradyrhizobium betae TaxID=244734 RepID=A0A5P6PEG5_9BRAD|nr:hypothetical protein [Bradyrhizobium betae]MCS3726185.1 hypothetical protein [Bradyrhizobium betae]QFI76739.1 hypothetical protein F8237_32670 [Bradyrhizobium betae]